MGHLVPVKGHDLSLQALARLAARWPDLRMCFVGDGPQRAALQAQATALGIADQVRFVGAVPNPELATWYSAADAMLLSSRSEGWAHVLLEAMACGTPVVATNVGGTSEVLAAAVAGRLVAPHDPLAIADGLNALLADLPDRDAVRTYAEGFGWQRTSDAQLQLFRDVLARAPGGRGPN